MRAPFQVIVFPYRVVNRSMEVLIGERSDDGYWQAVSGGGENSETFLEAAKRELAEETGLHGKSWIQLDSMCTLPKVYYSGHENWNEVLHVIPEYAFATQAYGELIASSEHARLEWHGIDSAESLLRYDSNRNALWELCRRVNL